MENKYYWLKLKKDFFKRHDIKIIEAMQNGKDYILFYLKLLCESVDHEGNLRFSEQIPYNEDMLSVITNTNIDVVRSAIKIFTQLNMMEIMDDGTYFMNEVNKMIGSEGASAERVRKHRELKAQKTKMLQCNNDVTNCNIEKDIDIEKDKELEIKKDIKEKKHKFGSYGRVKLTDKEYQKLINEFGKDSIDNLIEKLDEYIESNNNKNKYTNFNLVIRKAIREHWFNVKESSGSEWWDNKKKELEEDEEKKRDEELSSGSKWLDDFKKQFK